MESNSFIRQTWSLDSKDVLLELNTTQKGLPESSIVSRLNEYGKNIFKAHDKKTAFSIFIKQILNPLIFILIGATLVTILLKDWIEAFVIGMAVMINVSLGFYREYHAENTLEKLSSFIKNRVRVVRDGKEQEVDTEMIFPGDIIKLSYGNRVPADARLISINNIRLNESILTGESEPAKKSLDILSVSSTIAERTNMVHAGTMVVDGFATAVVVATGNNTEIGKIAKLVYETSRAKTPIQKSIENLAWVIFTVVMLIVAIIFAFGVFKGEPIFKMLILSVAVGVGAVPESLPIALTVILSIGAERIAKKKGITRTLIAAETLGSTSLIMTDKTGTLTEANMKLIGAYTLAELQTDNTDHKKYNPKEKELLEVKLNNGATEFEKLQEIAERISDIIVLLDRKEMRWLELSERADI